MSSAMTELELLEYFQKYPSSEYLDSAVAFQLMNARYLKVVSLLNEPKICAITDKGLYRLEQLRHEQTKAQLAAWEALGRELKYAFGITTVEDSIYLEYRTGAFGQVDGESYIPDEPNSANERRYKALSRLLELTRA